ncbi:MAG TPA: hypothetical protein VLM40_11045, partial [Gemmata sp.]|nr:hypothetical protein [Gemmata sp.]
MWRWLKHWIDWLRNEFIPLSRLRRTGYAVHVRYEQAGGPHTDLPIPWTADAVLVELVLRLPYAARRKLDFTLRFPGLPVTAADSVRPDSHDRHRVTFRFSVPHMPVAGEVLWKQQSIASVALFVLTTDSFLRGLTIANPSVAARFGQETVAARAVAAE